MKERNQCGSALAMTTGFTLFLCVIGVCVVLLMIVIGGNGQLQFATDSGALNVAKQLIKHPQVDLNSGKEEALFKGFTDKEDKVNLESYNKIEGAAMLVALNALEIHANNPANVRALNDAETVAKLVNTERTGIGARLAQAVKENPHASDDFLSHAMSNSVRMLSALNPWKGGSQTQATLDEKAVDYDTAQVGKGEAANVVFDTARFPQLPSSYVTEVDGQKYVHGYELIDLGAKLAREHLKFNFVSLFPKSQPHLVSAKQFEASTTFANVPANSVRGSGRVGGVKGNSNLSLIAHACATTAGIDGSFKPSLPSGYIILYNPAGYAGPSGGVPNSKNIYNTQLQDKAGVYVGKDAKDNPVAFSTDKDVMKKWADYNSSSAAAGDSTKTSSDTGTPTAPAAPASTAAASDTTPAPATTAAAASNTTPAPATTAAASSDTSTTTAAAAAPDIPTSGDNRVYQPDGQPIEKAKNGAESEMAKIKSWERITWRDTDNKMYQVLQPGMTTAYPAVTRYLPSGGGGLIALEKYKYDVIKLFCDLGANGAHGHGSGNIPVPAPSGLKVFNHDQSYANQVPFANDGSPYELMQQVINPHPNYAADNSAVNAMLDAESRAQFEVSWGEGNSKYPNQYDDQVDLTPPDRTRNFQHKLIERVRQIKPEATDGEVLAVLNSRKMPLNTVLFLYMKDPKGARTLVLTDEEPPAYTLAPAGTVRDIPDGDRLAPYYAEYVTWYRQINCLRDGGAEIIQFFGWAGFPSVDQLIASDAMLWTPSSGANGCLGLLEFQNMVDPRHGGGPGGTGSGQSGYWFGPN